MANEKKPVEDTKKYEKHGAYSSVESIPENENLGCNYHLFEEENTDEKEMELRIHKLQELEILIKKVLKKVKEEKELS